MENSNGSCQGHTVRVACLEGIFFWGGWFEGNPRKTKAGRRTLHLENNLDNESARIKVARLGLVLLHRPVKEPRLKNMFAGVALGLASLNHPKRSLILTCASAKARFSHAHSS